MSLQISKDFLDFLLLRAKIYIYTHTYIHTYIRTYIHTYIHTYVHTCIHINITHLITWNSLNILHS